MVFFDHLALSRTLLELGATGFGKFISPFAAIRLGGGGVTLSYGIQAFMTAAMLLAVVYAWRSTSGPPTQGGGADRSQSRRDALCLRLRPGRPRAGSCLCTVLRPRQRLPRYEKSFLALIWIAPILIRPLASTFFIPLGPPVIWSSLRVLCFVPGLTPGRRSCLLRTRKNQRVGIQENRWTIFNDKPKVFVAAG